MMKTLRLIAGLTCGICLFVHTAQAAPDTQRLDRAYQRALMDASKASAEELTDTLNAIHPDNDSLIWNADKSKLLVTTWKSQDTYDQFLKPSTTTSSDENHVVWVTLAPQVQQFCQAYREKHPNKDDRLILKLKQYLGLNHAWNYDVFVNMWVSPDDLFRPCVDPETNDTACNLTFSDAIPQVKNIQNYQDFYQNLYYNSFRNKGGAPWTGLGYTYNWGKKGRRKAPEIGASEYILVPGAEYSIKDAVPTLAYCSP